MLTFLGILGLIALIVGQWIKDSWDKERLKEQQAIEYAEEQKEKAKKEKELQLKIEEHEKRLVFWLANKEPIYTNTDYYPPDWETRRALVYSREKGKCQICNRKVGSMKCNEYEIFKYEHDTVLVIGAHVHHKKSISESGNHSLENLVLLHDYCHAQEHPNVEPMARISEKRSIEILKDSVFRYPIRYRKKVRSRN